MRRTRLSFFYLATYLLGAGVALALGPSVALKLLFSNGNYGDVMPRLLGVVLLALGLIIVQIIRHRVEALYLTTLGVRVVIIVGLVGLVPSIHAFCPSGKTWMAGTSAAMTSSPASASSENPGWGIPPRSPAP